MIYVFYLLSVLSKTIVGFSSVSCSSSLASLTKVLTNPVKLGFSWPLAGKLYFLFPWQIYYRLQLQLTRHTEPIIVWNENPSHVGLLFPQLTVQGFAAKQEFQTLEFLKIRALFHRFWLEKGRLGAGRVVTFFILNFLPIFSLSFLVKPYFMALLLIFLL